MKKNILLIASLFGLTAYSQITFNESDFVSIGDEIITTYDTTTPITITAPGANQIWDFSNLEDQKRDTGYGIDPSTAPHGAQFPDANLVLEMDLAGFKALGYLKKDPTKAEIVGVGYFSTIANFSDRQTFIEFPTTYNTRFEDYFAYTAVGPGSDFNLPFDSVKLEVTGTQVRTADAYGTVITPLGSFDAVRISDTTYDTTVTSVYSGGTWNVFTTDDKIEYRHTYATNHQGVKLSIISYNLNSSGALTGRVDWEYVDPSVGINENQSFDFSMFPNPTQNIVNISTKENISGYAISDLQGKIIQSNTGSNITSIDLTNLTSGSYIITLISPEGRASKLINKQ